ncbi:hypothetical protein [Gottfriedia acidiceleris]|uniref:hypothetical protein n=1 Tax=Gottfriedia acidiceleris TaxID=371036 RepID=UPI002FFD9DA2
MIDRVIMVLKEITNYKKMEVDDDFLTSENSYVFATSNIKEKERYKIIVPLKGNVKIKSRNDRIPNEEILKEFKDALKKNEL